MGSRSISIKFKRGKNKHHRGPSTLERGAEYNGNYVITDCTFSRAFRQTIPRNRTNSLDEGRNVVENLLNYPYGEFEGLKKHSSRNLCIYLLNRCLTM
ncbi:hypothetical protein HZS_2599 [Henneguya salminicola]|nr:hypothetical protein HZS_2599 [Henneguya salminicola]